jgi:diguanylate cyclase (GGDEF)-like protein
MRESDRIYRYGDEEFVVLCDGLAHRPALLAAERVRRSIALALLGSAASVTATIGVAGAPQDGADLASLLGAANRRLSEARAAGGDRVLGRADEEIGANVTSFLRREPG